MVRTEPKFAPQTLSCHHQTYRLVFRNLRANVRAWGILRCHVCLLGLAMEWLRWGYSKLDLCFNCILYLIFKHRLSLGSKSFYASICACIMVAPRTAEPPVHFQSSYVDVVDLWLLLLIYLVFPPSFTPCSRLPSQINVLGAWMCAQTEHVFRMQRQVGDNGMLINHYIPMVNQLFSDIVGFTSQVCDCTIKMHAASCDAVNANAVLLIPARQTWDELKFNWEAAWM